MAAKVVRSVLDVFGALRAQRWRLLGGDILRCPFPYLHIESEFGKGPLQVVKLDVWDETDNIKPDMLQSVLEPFGPAANDIQRHRLLRFRLDFV